MAEGPEHDAIAERAFVQRRKIIVSVFGAMPFGVGAWSVLHHDSLVGTRLLFTVFMIGVGVLGGPASYAIFTSRREAFVSATKALLASGKTVPDISDTAIGVVFAVGVVVSFGTAYLAVPALLPAAR